MKKPLMYCGNKALKRHFLGKKTCFHKMKMCCASMHCGHYNSVTVRGDVPLKTVTARPNEQLIQNAINWPQEVKTAFPKWKKSVLDNISQAWTPKKGSVARMLTNVKKSCSQTYAASNRPPYHEASFLQACHPKMTLKHCLCSENGQFADREK